MVPGRRAPRVRRLGRRRRADPPALAQARRHRARHEPARRAGDPRLVAGRASPRLRHARPGEAPAAQGRSCRRSPRTRSGPSRSRPSTAWSTAPTARDICRTRSARPSSCRQTAARPPAHRRRLRSRRPRLVGRRQRNPHLREPPRECRPRAERQRDLRRGRRDWRDPRAHQALRPRRAPGGLARRQVRCLHRVTTTATRDTSAPASTSSAATTARSASSPPTSTATWSARPGAATAAHLLPVRRPGHVAHRGGRPLRTHHQPRRRPRRRRLVAALRRRIVLGRARRHDRLQRERHNYDRPPWASTTAARHAA